MKLIKAPIISNEEITSGTNLLWLEAPEIAQAARPGQFVMVRCGSGCDLLLRRPLSIHRVRNGEQIALLFQKVGQGTEWLALCQKGDSLDTLGPLGNGFSLQPSSRNLLLVAGGIGIAPLVFLAEKALEEGHLVTMLMGAANAQSLYPSSMLPSGIEIICVTEDGSEGTQGLVTDLIPDFAPQADQIFACGPEPMYKSLAKKVGARHAVPSNAKSIQVSLEMRMGCGVGVCYSCTINTAKGLKQVCQDGPVFELEDINL